MSTRLLKALKIIFSVFFGLYLAIWTLSPYVINHYLAGYLTSQDLTLNDSTSIRYNPFRSRVEVNDLEILRKEGEAVFSLVYMSSELHLHRIIFDELYLPEIVIGNLNLSVETINDNLVVAGMSLSSKSADSDTNVNDPNGVNKTSSDLKEVEKEGEGKNEVKAEFPFEVILPTLSITQSNINYYDANGLHQLAIKDIHISDLFASLEKQSVGISIKSELDGAPIDIEITADFLNKNGVLNVDLNIVDFDVEKFSHLLPRDIDSLTGLVSYKGQHEINVDDQNIVLKINKGILTSAGLDAGQKEAHILIGKQEIKLDDIQVEVQPGKEPQLQARAEIIIKDINVYNKEKTKTLATVKTLNLKEISLFNNEKGLPQVKVAEFELLDSFFSDNQDNPIPALMKFTSLNIKDVEASQAGISVDHIELAGLIANAELDENKKVKNLLDIPTSSNQDVTNSEKEAKNDDADLQTNSTASVEVTKPNNTHFAIKLNSFKLQNTAEIFFLDQSVKPAYQRKIVINDITAGPFDTEKPEQESIITISGKSNRYASFDFKTIAKPFLNIPSYHINGDFKELSLPGLSSYIKQALQYEIESGQLDLGVDVTLTGTELEGEVNVLLRGIELTAADDHESSSLNDQTSVPFNMALGMLKDVDGNVELSLPISGDTSSPDFGVSGFLTLLVKQATIMGAKDYLVTTFVPYASVVNIAVLAGEYALKVRFNDLPYPIAEVEIQAEQEEFLQQFSALLKNNETTQVKLCAIAIAQDINKKAGSDISSKEDIKLLKEISRKRVDIFKEYMIKQEGIASSRLLLCTPQIDSSAEAVPRLSFST